MSSGYNQVTGEVVFDVLDTPAFSTAAKDLAVAVVADVQGKTDWIIGWSAFSANLRSLSSVPRRYWVFDNTLPTLLREATVGEKNTIDRNATRLANAKAERRDALVTLFLSLNTISSGDIKARAALDVVRLDVARESIYDEQRVLSPDATRIASVEADIATATRVPDVEAIDVDYRNR